MTWETSGFELASTINLVLQVNRLTKCASRQNTVPELQNSYSPLQVEDLPQQILIEENSSTVPQRKEIQSWVMSLGEDQIFAQQKNTFKHNSNCKNQK